MTRKTVLIMVALFTAVMLGVVLTVFQPQKLLIDEIVNEAAPVELVAESAAPSASESAAAASTDANETMAADGALPAKPGAVASSAAAAPKAVAPAAAPAATRGGNFRSLDHQGSGRASLVKTTAGYVVRFDDLDVENGPDLFVYLSPALSTSQASAFGVKPLILGKLKANKGNQNYAVPAGTDVSKYKSVAVWCKRFSSGFAVAPLV